MTTKAAARRRSLDARKARTPADITAARTAVRAHVLERVHADCIAAYEPLRTEPGSLELLDALADRGSRVLVPLLLGDHDLGWRVWGTSGDLGVAAIADASCVLVPALAVDHRGVRLGRGGGSYDRALTRVAADAVIAGLLFDDEFVSEALPADPWDVPMQAVVQPRGWTTI